MELPIAGVIQQSDDYSMFRYDRINRDVELEKPTGQSRKLLQSMKKKGFLKQYPVLVEKNGHGYIIKAGHHRFAFARSLNIPFYYLEIEKGSALSLTEAEESTKPWCLSDFIAGFAKDGKEAYIDAIAFAARYELSEQLAFAWLWGESDTANQRGRLKSGGFEIRNYSQAQLVAACYAQSVAQYPLLKGTCFAKALWAAHVVPYFDGSEFLRKLQVHGSQFITGRVQTRDAALLLIDSIWNRQRVGKVALAFDAKAALKTRQKTFGKASQRGRPAKGEVNGVAIAPQALEAA